MLLMVRSMRLRLVLVLVLGAVVVAGVEPDSSGAVPKHSRSPHSDSS
jgi:hypothetical protein